jgi:HAMP domain-containing protein
MARCAGAQRGDEALRGGKNLTSPEEVAAWTEKLQQQIRLGLAQIPPAQRGGRSGGGLGPGARTVTIETSAARSPGSPTTRSVTTLKGNALHTEVRQGGQSVGAISARLNTELLFGTLLRMTPRDRGDCSRSASRPASRAAPSDHNGQIAEANDRPPAEGVAMVDQQLVVAMRRTCPARRSASPARSATSSAIRASRPGTAAGFGLIVVVFVASIPLAGGMTRNLRTLMHGVQRLSTGDLAARVDVRSSDEFGRLGAAFNRMAENLAAHEAVVVKQERLRRELELCRLIQNEMLPHQPLRLGLAEVKGVSIPAREVGGDFFNYFVLPAGEIAVIVGDVSGKGVGAALLMANVQATLRARLPLEQDLAKLADGLDRDLQANTPIEVLDALQVSSTPSAMTPLRERGHSSQFVLRRQGGFERRRRGSRWSASRRRLRGDRDPAGTATCCSSTPTGCSRPGASQRVPRKRAPRCTRVESGPTWTRSTTSRTPSGRSAARPSWPTTRR